jgi:hypothetical protein
MSEGEEPQTTGPSDEQTSENPAKGTPPIGNDEQTPGQTQTPSADDDVGVPDDPGADTAGT